MKCVRLVKGMDYRGHGVKAFSGKPLTVEDSKAEELVATGFFKLKGTVIPTKVKTDGAEADPDKGEKGEGADDNSKGTDEKPLEKMKKDELIALAEEKGIDISSCTNNEERIEIIKAVLLSETEDGAEADFTE